jgi:hypothetical protein
MELNNTEILFLSELLIKMLKSDIFQKNINDQVLDNQFKEFTEPEKRKRGRPFGSIKKCIPSEK